MYGGRIHLHGDREFGNLKNWSLHWNNAADEPLAAEPKANGEGQAGGTGTIPGGVAGGGTPQANPDATEYHSVAGAFFGSIWDSVRLFDGDEANTNYDNLKADGYGSAASTVIGIVAAIGERNGGGLLEDARSGRDIAGNQLSDLQRAGRGTLGLGQLTVEALGLKGLPGAVRGAGSRLRNIFFPKTVSTKVDDVAQGATTVYRSIDADGNVKYVGITDDFERRAAEHLREKGINIEPIFGLQGISRESARAVEQVLIEFHGLGKAGGTLLNKINSISSPIYGSAIELGTGILAVIGYW